MSRVLAYFAPVEPGGLADYAVCQARALADTGTEIVFLGYPFIEERIDGISPNIRFVELNRPRERKGLIGKLFARIASSRKNVKTLSRIVDESRIKAVLISAFSEYFSPFWVGGFKRLAKQSVKIGVVVHDPIRDFVLGPNWWHRYSISQAYSFVSAAFVHEDGEIDTGWPPKSNLRSAVIPHGPYKFPTPENPAPKAELRKHFGIPLDANTLLCFGHIRDGKNLDAVIHALTSLPDVCLVVAGTEQSSGQRRAEWYQRLAEQVGVSDRCFWHVRFISDDEVYKFFAVSDAVVLLYSAEFRSASGVLNASAQFGLPVIASSGSGPLRTAVRKYDLGMWMEPNEIDELPKVLRTLFDHHSSPNWSQYLADNCWEQNAETVLQRLLNPINNPE